MDTSIEQLAKRARDGDRNSLGRLLLLHDVRLRRHLDKKLSPALKRMLSVDDLLQETYTAAYRHIGEFEFRGDHAFYKWLATIAERKYYDIVKKRRLKIVGTNRSTSDSSASLLGLARLVDKRARTPSRVAARKDAVRVMQLAIASLPESLRRVIWMQHIEGKPVKEIAAAIGRTERAVNQLCYRGMMQLREELGSRSKFLSDSR